MKKELNSALLIAEYATLFMLLLLYLLSADKSVLVLIMLGEIIIFSLLSRIFSASLKPVFWIFYPLLLAVLIFGSVAFL